MRLHTSKQFPSSLIKMKRIKNYQTKEMNGQTMKFFLIKTIWINHFFLPQDTNPLNYLESLRVALKQLIKKNQIKNEKYKSLTLKHIFWEAQILVITQRIEILKVLYRIRVLKEVPLMMEGVQFKKLMIIQCI